MKYTCQRIILLLLVLLSMLTAGLQTGCKGNVPGAASAAKIRFAVLPILDALRQELPGQQRGYVELLRQNLREITSPFADHLSRRFAMLTPTEIQVCDMIRRGLPSKTIAHMRHVSVATVNRHREHICRKLGLTGRGVNLAT